jgi:replicative DNA helicase
MEYQVSDQDQAVYQVAPDSIPHNREAEESVIGAVLIDPETFHPCRIYISSRDEFYIDRHKWIWDAYEQMFARGTPVDIVTLTDELDNLGTLHEVGGPAYITALISNVPSSLNASSYAEIVHKHYTRRCMINAANEIVQIAYNESIELEEGIAKATHSLSQAVATSTNAKAHSISDALKLVDAEIEERGKHGVLPGIPTGLIDLDELLGGGAQDSDLLLIAGRPGQGKTSLLLQIMKNAARYTAHQKTFHKRVAMFSLEMPERDVILRLISQLTGIDSQLLRSGNIPPNKISFYIHALEELDSLDIVIDDTPGVSPAYVRSRCEILNAEKKLNAVFLDSLNLMRSGLNFKRLDQEVDYNATELKTIAREFNIPFWAAHQMNRNKESRGVDSRPVLSDLREGGEQPSDIVMFIHHELKDGDIKQIKNSELIVAKHRNGPTDNLAVVFRGEHTKFENAFRVRSQP